MPKLIIFDLDQTLVVSKQALESSMAGLLAELLEKTRVGIISGGGLPQFIKQVVGHLPPHANLSHLYLLPTSGAALYEWKNEWRKVYEERIPESDVPLLMSAAEEGAQATGLIDFSASSWGERIEYRGSQVTLSALGQGAPPSEKEMWDPDKKKRLYIRAEIEKRLPKGYTASMGGATSIDIVRAGIDKAYGLHQLCMRLHLAESDALYVGDQLVAGGNDEAVFRTEAKTKSVTGPADTEQLMGSLLETSNAPQN